MANDRVIIRCSGCGAWKTLLKYFPTTGLQTRDNDILDWLDKHGAWCSMPINAPDLEGDPRFALHTEDSENLDPQLQNALPNYNH